MKVPKKIKRYCPNCKGHHEVKVMTTKSGGQRGTLSHGQRRHERRSGIKGYGGSPKQLTAQRAKTSKKIGLVFQCEGCKKKFVKQNSIRSKKFTQV